MALVWALYRALQMRGWVEVGAVTAALYLYALEVWSGLAIPIDNANSLLDGLLFVLAGPSATARWPIQRVPLAWAVTTWPASVHAAAALILANAIRRTLRRIADLPMSNPVIDPMSRAAVSLTVVATFELLCAAMRLLPYLLD